MIMVVRVFFLPLCYLAVNLIFQRLDGLMPVVRRLEIKYCTPLRTGDVVLSRLWIERKGPRFIFYQDLFRKADEVPVAKAVVTIVCMDKDGRINRGDELAERVAQYLHQS